MNELEKAKDYVKYRNGELPDVVRWLIKQAEKVEELQQENENLRDEIKENNNYWNDAENEVKELKKEIQRLETELMMLR